MAEPLAKTPSTRSLHGLFEPRAHNQFGFVFWNRREHCCESLQRVMDYKLLPLERDLLYYSSRFGRIAGLAKLARPSARSCVLETNTGFFVIRKSPSRIRMKPMIT